MNILIIKTGALGDVLRTSFIAQALKEKYVNKKKRAFPKIYWITQEKAKAFFLNNPYVDQVLDFKDKLSLNKLKKLKWDLVINLEEDLESCDYTCSLNFKEIRGFICKEEKVIPTPTAKEWYDMSAIGKKPENDILKKKNKKSHRQIISEIAGIDNFEKYEPFLRLTNEQRQLASDFLRRHNLSRKDLIIGINTGAADRWPKDLSVKKTVEMIHKLYKKFSAKIVLFGGPNEKDRNVEILKLSSAPIISAGCGNDFLEFPALISACNIFITTDTLGLHVALALKRKTICLIGPTSVSEISMYNLGEKIVAKSNCICCYKKTCKSMNKIEVEEIIFKVKKLLKLKITLLITAFNEPNISKSIESALNQKTDYEYDLIVSAPDKGTLEIVDRYSKKNKNLKSFKDEGKGKSNAINSVLPKIDSDILILTDGDVYLNEDSIEEITNAFLDPEIGCLSGRPIPQEDKTTKYGYWANFLFEAAHRIRIDLYKKNSFLECSGYLFAFRKNNLSGFPVDVAEDTIIAYMFWEKGYKIGYVESAKVYVKNTDNLRDWFKQKIRTHNAHTKLKKYVDTLTTMPVKSFKTELRGIFWLIKYPLNLKEFFWSIQLASARFSSWLKYFFDVKLLNKEYSDAWERVESTK